MADVGQGLLTIGSVSVGAGLTYLFTALNRSHQEAREDRTRWYEARFKAYAELSEALFSATLVPDLGKTYEERKRRGQRLFATISAARLVGSDEVIEVATRLLSATTEEMVGAKKFEGEGFNRLLQAFETAARKDLGHPEPAVPTVTSERNISVS